jgi:hypothetical protein
MHRNYLLDNPLKIIISVLLILSSFAAASQSNPTQALYWIRYQAQLNFNERLYWTNEIDNRRFFGHDIQHQFIVHSRLHYRVSRWDFGAGLTISNAYAQYSDAAVSHPLTELRPVVEATYESKVGRAFLQNRIRLDNRFFETDKYSSVFDDALYVARFRYRLQVRYPIAKKESRSPVSLKLAEEIMVNHRNNFFDQNRIYGSVEVPLSKNASFELGYIFIYQQRFRTENYLNRNVFRFSFLHRLSL